jgi:hypothetical protein
MGSIILNLAANVLAKLTSGKLELRSDIDRPRRKTGTWPPRSEPPDPISWSEQTVKARASNLFLTSPTITASQRTTTPHSPWLT